ncbi:sensor histidine kinase [Undibacterium sp. Ren11W]|uniref:sensor histidine kinase n=1 Tax=Undibacterium sp. Ren11W TaxID=3413045 RepID=UPI003BF1B67F
MTTSLLPLASSRKISLPMQVCYSVIVNTAIALFITYGIGNGERLQTNWVFSMLIGLSIGALINGAHRLIWKDAKPQRLAFLMVCCIAAPLGYYFGYSMGMLIYGYPLERLFQHMLGAEHKLVIMSIIISLFFGILFLSQTALSERKLKAEQEKTQLADIQKQAMQAKLQLLQAQIEPHMLFNTLANLQGLIALDTERAQYMLEQLIHYLRASLNSSRAEKTTLKQEFALMHAYLELLAIRMGKRLTYQLDLPPELDAKELAPMLLQPLVENAIKHGVEPKMEGGHIHVSAAMRDGILQLQVADTGLGLPDDYDDSHPPHHYGQHEHVGNANVRDRLLALYGTGATLTLSRNQPQGTLALLNIPYPS